MVPNSEVALAISLVLGWLHTGGTITCYDCTEGTGSDLAVVQNYPGLATGCLNKKTKECEPGVKLCIRATIMNYKPHSYELNIQSCALSGANKTECPPWEIIDNEKQSAKGRTCYCSGDKCNAAARRNEYPSSSLGLFIMWCIVRFVDLQS